MLGENPGALCYEASVGRDILGPMMMEPFPAANIVVIENGFLRELLEVAFDPPLGLDQTHRVFPCSILRNRRNPVVRRLGFSFRPFDQQPLLRSRRPSPIIPMGQSDPHRRTTSCHASPRRGGGHFERGWGARVFWALSNPFWQIEAARCDEGSPSTSSKKGLKECTPVQDNCPTSTFLGPDFGGLGSQRCSQVTEPGR